MFNISSKNDKKALRRRLSKFPLPRISPLPSGWKGAIFGVSIVTLFICLVQAFYYLGSRGVQDYFVGTILSILAVLGLTGLVAGVLHWAKKMPSRYVWFLLASIGLLYLSFLGPLPLTLSILLCILFSFSLLGALLYRFIKGSYREAARWVKVTASSGIAAVFIFICVLGYWLTCGGFAELEVQYPLQTVKTADNYSNSVANPAEPGTFRVNSVTYASNPTYRKDLDTQGRLTTKTVDGSAFVGNWSSRRTNTFGFGPEAMPLNGTVWYPEGDGPFPLVLVVHGNHLATEFSDPGYAYLGKLLASRGYILASIDENFLNISPYDDLFILDGLEGENRARGWLLLEHLKTWESWNASEGNPFHSKVDMQHIALMGHSRGGEAITTAAAYNQMTTYPEDATIKFDYHFNIQSLVSIAGTDMQYQPGGQPIELHDINYLSLHGSHDMDINSFVGANQYFRTRFTENSHYFKSYVYIYGANHGQFNTVWGKSDAAGIGNMLFNNSEILPGEQQIQAAEVLISSFLEATLRNNHSYRMVFQDLGYAKEWLPETMYISNYWDGNTTTLTNYEEDSDPGTTTLPGGRLEGDSLKVWKEDKVKMELSDEQYSAVFLEWDNRSASSTPVYKVILPDSGIDITDTSTLVFSIANHDTGQEAHEADTLVDLTISVEDETGNVSRLPLSNFSPLLPMFEGVLAKRPLGFFQTIKEPIFQNFAFDMNDFIKANTNLVPERIRKISFIFDQTTKGNILMKDIGIRNDKK
ncbi:MFS transporter [Paenibacillus sp. FSL W8-0426]|uniref:MFS transporter n=1 Tax=Paenibacillus sp. FSL W8-0426 TaxID=2921714 RepID=UPI0030D84A1D